MRPARAAAFAAAALLVMLDSPTDAAECAESGPRLQPVFIGEQPPTDDESHRIDAAMREVEHHFAASNYRVRVDCGVEHAQPSDAESSEDALDALSAGDGALRLGFSDAPRLRRSSGDQVCGLAHVGGDAAIIPARCWGTSGVATHEVLHMLGATHDDMSYAAVADQPAVELVSWLQPGSTRFGPELADSLTVNYLLPGGREGTMRLSPATPWELVERVVEGNITDRGGHILDVEGDVPLQRVRGEPGQPYSATTSGAH